MLTALSGMSALPLLPTPALTAEMDSHSRVCTFEIIAQPVGEALIQFALQANISINLPDGADRVEANALSGRFTIEEGLTRLLKNTGYEFEKAAPGVLRITHVANTAPVSRFEEIIVTATRIPTPANLLPNSVSVLTGAEAEARGTAETRDVATELSGVTVTNLGPGRDKILIRGMSDSALTGNTQSTVGIYLDEARLTYNAPDPDLKLVDIDRIEILRGPQGSLYGEGSIGGIYHIVTRKPDLVRYSGWAELGAAATMHGDPSANISGAVNLPLVRNRIALRLVGYAERIGGYIDDEAGPSNLNAITRKGMRAALKIALSDQWSLLAAFVQQKISAEDSQYVAALYNRLRRSLDLREPYENDFLNGAVTLSGSMSWGEMTSTTSVVRHEIDNRYDATPALSFFSASSIGPAPFDNAGTVELWTEELHLNSPSSSRIHWLGGLFLSQGTERQNSILTTFGTGGAENTAYRELREDRINELAFYGEADVPLTRSITAGVGLRWFMSSVSTESTVAQLPLPLSDTFNGTLTARGLAPKFVMSYQPTPPLMLYGQAAEGYRVGGFNTAGIVGEDFSGEANGLQPRHRFGKDELWNFEVGAKLTLLRGAMHINGAFFWGVWNNVQTDQLLPSGLSFTANAGDARNRGVEVEASYEEHGLSLRANAIINDPEFVHFDRTLPFQLDPRLPGVPDFSGGMALGYIHPIGGGFDARFDAEFNYVGKSHLGLEGAQLQTMGGYVDARVQLSLQKDHWRVSASIENPADIRGNTFSYGNPFSLRTVSQLTPVRPRTIGVSLSWGF